eukprot:gene798-1550_t
MENRELSVTFFLHRLRQLQQYCSCTNRNFPHALLFIPGPDGRHNKGSNVFLKYLFLGSVGKDLLDGFLETKYEALEETILLVQESSISVFYSHEAKALIGPLLAACPFVIEYLPSLDEEQEVDLFESNKCESFKRMMLQAVPEGEAVGIPVPIGYEDVQDTESWPLLQSFAMDEVFCATGFFTARYAVVDITDNLDTIFHSVDGFYVERAIDTLRKNVIPHAFQTIGQFETQSVDQRTRVSVETALAPYELLFDFGALEAGHPADPLLKPVLLFGTSTRLIGTSLSQYPRRWKEGTVGNSIHAVIEASEPSTGLRWCRTYFLSCGRILENIVTQSSSLVAENNDNDSNNNDEASGVESQSQVQLDRKALVSTLSRLESLYVKLWLGLRWAVGNAFARHTDVLEAGSTVQQLLEELLKKNKTHDDNDKNGNSSSSNSTSMTGGLFDSWGMSPLESVVLEEGEVLQVHMDCVDGLGRVVKIEDVDDMGGQCWTYFRIAVHGISYRNIDSSAASSSVSVAVGDTFLFSSGFPLLCGSLAAVTYAKKTNDNNSTAPGLRADRFCVTHSIPYYRNFIGVGLEDVSVQRLLNSVRNPHTRASYGLSSFASSTVYTGEEVMLPLLTDHPLVSVTTGELQLHASGFIVHRLDNVTCLPIVIDLASHVESIWTIDSDGCWDQTCEYMGSDVSSLKDIDELRNNLPEGLFILLQLKTFVEDLSGDGKDDDDTATTEDNYGNDQKEDDEEHEQEGKEEKMVNGKVKRTIKMVLNPLAQSLGTKCLSKPCRHLAIFVRAGGRETGVISSALNDWRRTLRAHDVPEHKGSKDVPLPTEFLMSFLSALDSWVLQGQKSLGQEQQQQLLDEEEEYPVADARALLAVATRSSSLLCVGRDQRVLSCSFAVAEGIKNYTTDRSTSTTGYSYIQRVLRHTNQREASNKKGTANKSSLTNSNSDSSGRVVVVFGHPGSGLLSISFQMAFRLQIKLIVLDLSEGVESLSSCVNKSLLPLDDGQQIVLAVVMSPINIYTSSSVLQMLRENDIDVRSVVTVGSTSIVPPHIGSSKSASSNTNLNLCLGAEVWRASSLEVFRAGVSDISLLVSDSTAYLSLRTLIENRNLHTLNYRVDPSNNRLDDDIVDLISKNLNAAYPSTWKDSNTRAAAITRCCLDYKPSEDPQSSSLSPLPISFPSTSTGTGTSTGIISLRAIHIVPSVSSSSSAWDSHLLQITLNRLFPQAVIGCTSASNETWNIPTNNDKSFGLKRAIFLAKVKVFFTKQKEQSRAKLDEKFHSKSDKQLLALRQSIFSVHGLVNVGTVRDTSRMSIEACSSHIMIRSLQNVQRTTNEMVIHGLFSDEQIILLQEIFGWCERYLLKQERHLVLKDIGPEHAEKLQEPFITDTLPHGWFYDGSHFLDFNGNRRILRPDIDDIVLNYIEEKNSSIDEYNSILDEIKDFI